VTGGVLKAAAVPAGILAVLFFAAFSLSIKKPWSYQSTLIATGVVISAAAFLNHLFVGTRPLGLLGKLLATTGAFVAAAALVYAVYYQQDMVNLLYDSIHYSMEKGEW
jgi:hypothetical protein